MTRNIAKFVIMVRDREMLAQRIKEAFYIARSGKPGPVLVDLPTDVMAELGSTSYPTEVNIRGYKPNKGVHVGQLKKAITLLEDRCTGNYNGHGKRCDIYRTSIVYR